MSRRGTLRYAALLAAAALLLAWYWPHVRNEAFVIIGNRDEAGAWYGFWSGFAGGVRVFEWVVIGALIWYHHTCHDHTLCLRWGRYPAAGGLFRLCAVHHPDLHGTKPHRELIHRLHAEHKAGKRP